MADNANNNEEQTVKPLTHAAITKACSLLLNNIVSGLKTEHILNGRGNFSIWTIAVKRHLSKFAGPYGEKISQYFAVDNSNGDCLDIDKLQKLLTSLGIPGMPPIIDPVTGVSTVANIKEFI